MSANSPWRRRAVYSLAALLVLAVVYLLVRPPATIVTQQPLPGQPGRIILSVTFPLWPGGDSNTYDANLKHFHVSARFPVEVRKGACVSAHVLEKDMDCPVSGDPLQITDERHGILGRWNRVVVSYELDKGGQKQGDNPGTGLSGTLQKSEKMQKETIRRLADVEFGGLVLIAKGANLWIIGPESDNNRLPL